MFYAHTDKSGHWCVLSLAQTGQTAAKHLICEWQTHRFVQEHQVECEWWKPTTLTIICFTFDVAFVSDGLIGGPTSQKLLQLHPSFLLIWGVHAHRSLHHWGRCADNECISTYYSVTHIRNLILSHLCSSWCPAVPSPCPVSQLLGTLAYPLQWPRQTPRPGRDTFLLHKISHRHPFLLCCWHHVPPVLSF